MMKKIATISKFLTVTLLSVLSFSCVKDTDYEIPDISAAGVEKFDGEIKTIEQVKSASSQEVAVYSANDAIEGYVVSSDKGGNFYRKIYIQNEEKTAAFAVSLEGQGLYGQYPLGAKVRLKLVGLTTQLVDGFLEVGSDVFTAKNGTKSVGRMPQAIYKEQLVNLNESKTMDQLAKKSASIQDLATKANTGMLLTLENVQFASSDIGKKLHRTENDKFAGTDYNLQDSNNKTLVFRTSRYAKFKDEVIPSGKLNVTGVLTTYRGKFQFMISNFEDIQVVGAADNTGVQDGGDSSVTDLDASSATASDYQNGKKVRLTGKITVEGGKSYIVFSTDNTKILLYAPSSVFKTLSEGTKNKLKTNNIKVTAVGVFTDYQKNGTTVKQLVYNAESDLTFGEVEAAAAGSGDNNTTTTNDTTDGGTTGTASSSNSFDFENITGSGNGYNQSGSLSADNGTVVLSYDKVRTDLDNGKYAISGKGLMIKHKNTGYIKITFKKQVGSVTFKYRSAYDSTSKRKVVVYDGDQNSTTVLQEKEFDSTVTSETMTINISGKPATGFTITIKNGNTKQIVIDDITWN